MDSSRGGPLSTLILMLPLIVVPALVVMRPSEQDSGFVGKDLSASVGDEFLSEDDGFDSMFAEETAEESSRESGQSAAVDLLEVPFDEYEAPRPAENAAARAAQPPDGNRTATADQPPRSKAPRTPDLSRWGVTSSVWFTPGNPDQIGFAAFVPMSNGTVRYRFAAIGDSDRQVIEEVLRQIEEWQSAQTRSSRRRQN